MTEATTEVSRVRFQGWTSPQMLLGIAGVLTFFLVPIHINTVYEGLPAHPLFLHVPVILIPTVSVGGLILVSKTQWFERHALWLCALTVFTLGALNLTMGAGDALRGDLGLYGNFTVANLIARHAAAASKLRVFMIFYTASFIVLVALDRQRRGLTTGIAWLDGLLGGSLSLLGGLRPARVVMGLLALGSLYFVFLTGDLGARAVWANRLPSSHPQFSGLGGAPSGTKPLKSAS